MDITNIIEDWGKTQGFWTSRQGCSGGTLKIAKTEAQPGYLRVVPDGSFWLYPEGEIMHKLLDLSPANPDFFDRLKVLILERTT